jgi:malate synthase
MDPASRQARGRPTIDAALCSAILDEELAKLREVAENGNRYEDAAELFRELVEAPTFLKFLTLPAYDLITAEVA